jgi:hypothetical protein
MPQEFIIADDTAKYLNASNPLNERLLYSGDELWSRNLDLAKKYSDINEAVKQALIFHAELPVKVFMVEMVPNGFNMAEVHFQQKLAPPPSSSLEPPPAESPPAASAS